MAKAGGPVDLAGIDSKIAQALGTTADQVTIADMAVHPASHNVYVTVTRGKGVDAKPVLLKVTANAATSGEHRVARRHQAFRLEDRQCAGIDRRARAIRIAARSPTSGSRTAISGSPVCRTSSSRRPSVGSPSRSTKEETTTLQIYHVSHKRSETQAPVMAFAPVKIDGKLEMLAAYTCTPIVAFDASQSQERPAGHRAHRRRPRRGQPAGGHGLVYGERQELRARREPHASDDEAEHRRRSRGAPALTTPDNDGIRAPERLGAGRDRAARGLRRGQRDRGSQWPACILSKLTTPD